ncbi:iron ABC transporter substrate-binding protein [Lentisphaera profundi]|uniref:Iron ABC transporter substrate-binding protein n=1 Tax=Lentisphaera profundi TaxID=1658616 RepID=A0ABY7W174_9BACT|nr:iron ABC transporter substrate-binding protein [Lentisphaera profundi]WDE99175.1 iron ABC transporter substrate-binding protein [Lentisphaera profundi]
MKKLLILALALLFASCDNKTQNDNSHISETKPIQQNPEAEQSLLIYTGRKAKYAQPLFDLFTKETGIKITVKEGKTAQLANTILREGKNSPADLFFAQDSSNLGALSNAGVLEVLAIDTLKKVDARYAGPKGDWIGTSGRARVLVYNKNMVKAEELPKSITELTDPKWKGRLGWAPKNGSFQSHLTAMTKVLGKEKTAAWVKDLKANEVKDYPKNTPIVIAVAEGKVAAGLVNHYYLYKVRQDMKEALVAENHFFADGDAGMFINVSGIALLKSSKNQVAAQKFINWILSEEAQTFFKNSNFEYPLAAGVSAFAELKPLEQINPVEIDLGDLDKVDETIKILEENGAL